MGIRAVIFDVGGVLVHEEPVEQLVQRWHERSGLPMDELIEQLRLLDPVATSTGHFTEGEFIAYLREEFALDDHQVADWVRDLWDWYCATPNEVMRGYARSLRPERITAILSNSFDGARREEARRYDFAADFEPIVYSHEIGVAKPHPRAFGHVLEAIGCRPEQCVFVDDQLENVEAAQALGIRAVHYIDTESTLAALDRLLER